ncbi:MAG: CvpA family protein [Gemmataceae bacterium]|nr:CvpA family protein [Gemmataceae bacterium]
MILMIFTLVLMVGTGVSQYRNGLFSAVAMLIKVLIAGLVAFGFWEPIADFLDPVFQNNTLAGSEDMISMVVLFSLTLFVLRLLTNYLAPDMIDAHGVLQYFGGGGVGILTGYLVAGFLICAMQTLPLDDKFLGFEPRSNNEPAYRSVYPPDRVWLVMMRHAGAVPFSWKEEEQPAGDSLMERYVTFDRDGTFELRYRRYRRGMEGRPPVVYFGEFDKELGRQPNR